jgi:hypothetical protein
MSFSINSAKVEELLASGGSWSGEIPFSEATLVPENDACFYPSYSVGGTTYAFPALITSGTREHLLALRKRIEASGVPLISTDELDAEIREMRR